MKKRFIWVVYALVVGVLLMTSSITLAQTLPLPQGDLGDYQLIEGDIMLPISAIEGRSTFEARKWPKGRIPYRFHASVTVSNQNKMLAAMTEWESVSGLDFIPYTGQNDYIHIINSGALANQPSGNWSFIGRVGGRQYLSIFNWDVHYTMMHELAHAAGIWHEQSRPDRNQYVTIQFANIAAGTENNFAIRRTADTVGTYDFASIMHYPSTAFSMNGQPTIVAKPGYEAHQSTMGNRAYLTETDKIGMQAHYPQAGDLFSSAIPVELDSDTHVTTTYYTKSANDPKPWCNTQVSRTAWFKVSSPVERGIVISSSGYDTTLAVYTGNPSELKLHGCANLLSTGAAETIMLNAKAGTTYYIMVGANPSIQGDTDLTVDLTPYRNLVKNGDFEWGTTGWTVTHSPTNRTDDKITCKKNIEGGFDGAYGSPCVFNFKGGVNEASRIVQNIPFKNHPDIIPSIGDSYLLRLNALASGGAAIQAKVVITYKNGTTEVIIDQTLTITGANGGYLGATGAPSRADIKKFTVTITNLTISRAQIRLDNIQLRQLFSPEREVGAGVEALPLP